MVTSNENLDYIPASYITTLFTIPYNQYLFKLPGGVR